MLTDKLIDGIIRIISHIIESRKIKVIQSTKNIKIDTLPGTLLGEIASYLRQRDHIRTFSMTAMLHFLWLFLITHTSPTLLSMPSMGTNCSDLPIDNANYILNIHVLKILNMVQIGIRNEAERQGVHKYTLGITVVIFNSELYFYVVSHTESDIWIVTVFSHQKLFVTSNGGTSGVQVILFEKSFDYDELFDEECKDSVLIIKDINLLIIF